MEIWEIALGVVGLLVTVACTSAAATAATYSLVSNKIARAHERIDLILQAYDAGDDTLHDRANQLAEKIGDLKTEVLKMIGDLLQRVTRIEAKLNNGMSDEIRSLRDAKHTHANQITGLHAEMVAVRGDCNGLRVRVEKLEKELT